MFNSNNNHTSFSRAVLSKIMTDEQLEKLDMDYEDAKKARRIELGKNKGVFCRHCGGKL